MFPTSSWGSYDVICLPIHVDVLSPRPGPNEMVVTTHGETMPRAELFFILPRLLLIRATAIQPIDRNVDAFGNQI